MGEPTILSLKLLIDTKGKRVLFAETDKNCVDFLFHILSLPVATVISSLLKNEGLVGSLSNIYESLQNLHHSYIQPNQSKDTLLKPVVPGYSAPLTLLLNDATTTTKTDHQKKFYKCSDCTASYVTEDPTAVCPSCSRKMSMRMSYVAPPAPGASSGSEGGFVKGVVTYMVLDDLSIMPLSSISSITLLNKFNVKDVSALEEKVVSLGMNEAVKLLKASLQSKKVLTDVFLENVIGCELPVEETNDGSLD